MIVGYVWQILGKRPFCPPPIREQPQKCPSWIGFMLWNSTFWSRLKLTVQIQLALHSCDPVLVTQVAVVTVSKNIISLCWMEIYKWKLDSKRFINFKFCYILPLNATTITACFARDSCISWKQLCIFRTGTESLKQCIRKNASDHIREL